MSQLGIGDYAGDVDVGQIAPGVLSSSDGRLRFWIEVIGKNGASAIGNDHEVEIWYCTQPVLGPPPVPDPVILFFDGDAGVNAGDAIFLEWGVSDAPCGVTLNGTPVSEFDSTFYDTTAADANSTITFILEASGGEDCTNPIVVTGVWSTDVIQP
jgi:hypothetical protein